MNVVLSFVIGLAPYIPIMLQVAGILIQMFGASKENLAAYQAMIQNHKDDGLITVQTADILSDFHTRLAAERERQKAEKEAAKAKGA